MNEINLKNIIEDQIDTFLYAGNVAIKLRNEGLKKETKSDGTPVSNGDIEINKIIIKKILDLTPNLPIVSEETSHNKSTKNLTDFWLVDPIDGTYDYINNLDEFTINAGLILNKKPVAGLIYAPAKKRMFYSYGKGMAFELSGGKLLNMNCNKKNNEDSIKFVSKQSLEKTPFTSSSTKNQIVASLAGLETGLHQAIEKVDRCVLEARDVPML